MGVAISSVSLGFLTFSWSFICVIFRSVGSHARAGELLIILSILTGKYAQKSASLNHLFKFVFLDVATISTFGLFMGKDNRLYPFRFYGLSFWLSVAASCGFFLTSILFAVNRINIGFKYMLRNYQNQFSD